MVGQKIRMDRKAGEAKVRSKGKIRGKQLLQWQIKPRFNWRGDWEEVEPEPTSEKTIADEKCGSAYKEQEYHR